ncbi:MAG TPA: hypothetical protein VML75_10210 [Kofleriaceae bacterium]|nr:hypothetical protein [Kofleriaceae bacterium]
MKPATMLSELEAAATDLSVKVSYETLLSSVGSSIGIGGLCRVKGQLRVIIDKRATPRERVATVAQALSKLDTSRLTLSAPVREVIEYYSLRRAS